MRVCEFKLSIMIVCSTVPLSTQYNCTPRKLPFSKPTTYFYSFTYPLSSFY